MIWTTLKATHLPLMSPNNHLNRQITLHRRPLYVAQNHEHTVKLSILNFLFITTTSRSVSLLWIWIYWYVACESSRTIADTFSMLQMRTNEISSPRTNSCELYIARLFSVCETHSSQNDCESFKNLLDNRSCLPNIRRTFAMASTFLEFHLHHHRLKQKETFEF